MTKDARRDAKKRTRRDGWINDVSGHGTARDRRSLTRFGLDVVTDLEAQAMWRSDWLAAKIIETVPLEAFRRGWTLKIDGDRGKDQAEKIGALCEEMCVAQRLTLAAQYERAYGGAAIYPVIEGATGDLNQELGARIAKVRALHVLEPRELMPVAWETDISSPNFGQPSRWRLQSVASSRGAASLGNLEIHASRLIVLPGLRVSSQIQPGQRPGWGDSVLSRPRGVMADFGLAWGSAATLLADFAQGVLTLDGLSEILAADDGEALVAKRLAVMDMARSSLRSMVIDAKDAFSRSTTPISGLSDVLTQFAQLVAAAADMPVTVLMGMSPAGMNATGAFDLRAWYDRIGAAQTKQYQPPLERVLRLLMRSAAAPTAGREPSVWSIEWLPLWEPTEKERAETRKLVAETDKIYVDAKVVSEDDVARSRWSGDTYSAEMTIDWNAREAQATLADEQLELDDDDLAAMGRTPRRGADEVVTEDN